jgi:hypothetical protein
MVDRLTGAWRVGLLRCRRTGRLVACYVERPQAEGPVDVSVVSSRGVMPLGPFPSWPAALRCWDRVRADLVRRGWAADAEAYQ